MSGEAASHATGGDAKSGLKLTALAVPEAAKVLSAAAGRLVSADSIHTDIRDGAPTNADGTVNLIAYVPFPGRAELSGYAGEDLCRD